MSDAIEFDVVDVMPAPQGSKTAIMRNGKAVVIEGSSTVGRKMHRAFRAAIKAEALIWRAEHGDRAPLDEPVTVRLLFRFPPTKQRTRLRHATKPDLDKLIRSVLDALVDARLLVDDSRVHAIVAAKVYAIETPPGVSVVIERDGAAEAVSRERRRAKEAG